MAGTAGLIQTIILYATTMLTFAYCVRMFSLVFMAPETEHIKQQHVHESPKIMMIPATILASLCIIWGVAEPLIASFMHVELAAGTGLAVIGEAFMNLETPIFLGLLIPTGLIAYFTYYKGFQGVRNIASGKNPLATTLKHAFFFDDVYNAFGRGINGFSAALTRFENSVFARIPDSGAGKVAAAAEPGHATTLKKGPSESFRNYVAAAVLGFILIMVLIILTIGGL
jgi:NADH:ubiquinone oxidoreductase subunit 5 (subunit L)/multisubunit Na+/H+ antiporter MnhA subunit